MANATKTVKKAKAAKAAKAATEPKQSAADKALALTERKAAQEFKAILLTSTSEKNQMESDVDVISRRVQDFIKKHKAANKDAVYVAPDRQTLRKFVYASADYNRKVLEIAPFETRTSAGVKAALLAVKAPTVESSFSINDSDATISAKIKVDSKGRCTLPQSFISPVVYDDEIVDGKATGKKIARQNTNKTQMVLSEKMISSLFANHVEATASRAAKAGQGATTGQVTKEQLSKAGTLDLIKALSTRINAAVKKGNDAVLDFEVDVVDALTRLEDNIGMFQEKHAKASNELASELAKDDQAILDAEAAEIDDAADFIQGVAKAAKAS
jgi:hypothetical protein